MDDAAAIAAATTLIESLAPRGAPVPIRTALLADECRWFLRSVQAGIVEFDACTAAYFRFKKWGSGPDHFLTPAEKPRHLFSKPDDQQAWLNREYVPHIAAYAKAILHHGYDRDRSSFSRYRAFSRDLIIKKAGGNYETDAEFYGHDETLLLQIEAKASERQTQALARAIDTHGSLRDSADRRREGDRVRAGPGASCPVGRRPRFRRPSEIRLRGPPRRAAQREVRAHRGPSGPLTAVSQRGSCELPTFRRCGRLLLPPVRGAGTPRR